jgi:methyl-accepting chemotaxis protein
METKVATALATGSSHEVAEVLGRSVREQLGGADPTLAFVFASTKQPLPELLPLIQRQLGDAMILGASAAGEFTEKGDAKGSATVFAATGDFRVFAGMSTGLKADVESAVGRAIHDLPPSVEGFPHRTAILLLDPLAGRGEEATLLAAAMLGGDVRLAGGAAGDDLHMKETHVGVNGRAESDALVIALIFSKQPLGVGVCHGHVPLSHALKLKVTKAQGNIVSEINGRPAWDVWVEETRESAAKRSVDPDKLSPDEIGGFLLRYEAGLATGSSYKVRAPLSRADDGSLGFACGMPEGTEFTITESEPEQQVESAREAARRALAQVGNTPVAGAVVFDCICRNLILGPRFASAVHSIADELGGVQIAGLETYGEIALDAGDMSGFHNTTTVVLTFPKGQ